jgi:hypothetical protein
MAYMGKNLNNGILLSQEFLEDSCSNIDEMRKTNLPKNLNIKHGINQYKIKLGEQNKIEKQIISKNEKFELDKSKSLYSPEKWGNNIKFIRKYFFKKLNIFKNKFRMKSTL